MWLEKLHYNNRGLSTSRRNTTGFGHQLSAECTQIMLSLAAPSGLLVLLNIAEYSGMDVQNAWRFFGIFVWKPDGKRSLGRRRRRRRWESLMQICSEDGRWMQMALDHVQLWVDFSIKSAGPSASAWGLSYACLLNYKTIFQISSKT